MSGHTLNITSINRAHMGGYVCMANNGVNPPANQTFYVEVHCEYEWIFCFYHLNTKNMDRKILGKQKVFLLTIRERECSTGIIEVFFHTSFDSFSSFCVQISMLESFKNKIK